MSDRLRLTRRGLLARGLALGCSAAASPFVTPIALASAPWDARLVVIILRGGMDGLDVVQPWGDRDFASLRKGALAAGPEHGASDLDGFFSLHPALAPLMPLWSAGQLGFAHAVATPYRDKRSHFDGQDLLEAGTGYGAGQPISRDGWLNRMLQSVPGVEAQTAFAIGREDLLVLNGAAPVANWSPDTSLEMTPQAESLLRLVSEGDPRFAAAIDEAIALAASADTMADVEVDDEGMMAMQQMVEAGGGGHLKVAQFAVERLRADTRVAAFSLNGWDTHNGQAGALKRPLTQLAETIEALRLGLGDVWGKTAVLAMTEFGRTARENGTRGTDHGTGGAMIMAGGAVRGGKVYGDWPGLGEADLYDRRDLMPTADVRSYAAVAMEGLFGLDRGLLESAIFPGLDMGAVRPIIL